MSNVNSIHLSLKYVDKNHYGNDYYLPTCANDAYEMVNIARYLKSQKICQLPNEKATSFNLKKNIIEYSKTLNAGDFLLITYSGHGGQFGNNETWCLYDRMFIDKELKELWSNFKPGVRILIISDSCNSGDIFRLNFDDVPVIKGIPKIIAQEIYNYHKDLYDNILTNLNQNEKILAHIKLFASSDKDNPSYILKKKNLSEFTEKLITVWMNDKNWNKYGFTKDYNFMQKRVSKLLTQSLSSRNYTQNPVLVNINPSNSFANHDIFLKI